MTLEQLNIISQYAEKKRAYYMNEIQDMHAFRKCRSADAPTMEECRDKVKYFSAVLKNVNAQIEEFIKMTVIL